jgi:aminoglycoside phosphotransferase (APT) family kinase protein
VTSPFAAFKSDEVSGLVDETRLAAWLDGQGLAPGSPLRVRRISGGMSNESIGIERGGARYVMRRTRERRARGRRSRHAARVPSAHGARGTTVPHPKPVALCEDPSVAGGVAYLMEHVDGFAPGLRLPEPFAGDAGLQRGIALAAMSALGELARVDWRARGLEDFGRPEGFHDRQVERWGRQLAHYGTDAGRDLSGLREVGAWLESHRPARDEWRPRSCTATTTWPTSSSRPIRPRGSPRSSTGRTRRSATRCSTSRPSCACWRAAAARTGGRARR